MPNRYKDFQKKEHPDMCLSAVAAAKLLVLVACFAFGYRLTGGLDELRGVVGMSGDEG